MFNSRFTTSLLITFFMVFLNGCKEEKKSSYRVALTQILPHPSLDKIRRGIEDGLQSQDVQIIFQNAQGSMTTATQIAHKFVALKPHIIVSITTPSTQAVYGPALKAHIPVIFAAISDPVAAKLLDSITQPNVGITGVIDEVPYQDQSMLIQALLPKGRIGIIYNPGEVNAVTITEKMKEILQIKGYHVHLVTASSTNDVAVATQSLVGKVDAIYVSTDNTVASAMEALTKIARQHKIMTFCSDPESVQRGCMVSLAYNQYKIGLQCAALIIKILKGVNINSLPPLKAENFELYVNTTIAQSNGVDVYHPIFKNAQKIDTKETL